MLKNTLRPLIIATLMAVCALMADASVYTWSRYHLTFEVPDGGFVTYQSNTRFEIQWDEMVMTIQLYNKEKSNDKLIKENLQRKALGYSMYDLKAGNPKVKGFKCFDIVGTMPDGSRALITDLVSKKQDLIVEITINYLYGARETADDIVKSFAENDKQQPNKEKKRQRVQSKDDAEKQQKQQPKSQPQPRRDEKLFDA